MDMFRRRPRMAQHSVDTPAGLRQHPVAGTMVFGVELVMDLDDCAPERIASADSLREYARRAVDLAGMKAFGEPIVQHFGHADPITSGFTLVQLIETSSLTGHFSELLQRAHLNLFSCREFGMADMVAFSTEFFGAQRATTSWLVR